MFFFLVWPLFEKENGKSIYKQNKKKKDDIKKFWIVAKYIFFFLLILKTLNKKMNKMNGIKICLFDSFINSFISSKFCLPASEQLNADKKWKILAYKQEEGKLSPESHSSSVSVRLSPFIIQYIQTLSFSFCWRSSSCWHISTEM